MAAVAAAAAAASAAAGGAAASPTAPAGATVAVASPAGAPVTDPPKGPSLADQKAAALAERLERKAQLMATAMRKFLAAYWAAKSAMDADARVAAAAKKAGKGKKGKKGKKEDGPAKGKDSKGDKKKATKTPVQEAWAALLGDLDERINKQKRFNLEDIHRAVGALTPRERRELAVIVVASNNKKVLPVEGQNANSMNIREVLFAAAAAFDVTVDKATVSPTAGLAVMSQRGASEEQLIEHGFRPSDLIRAGCGRVNVIAACAHEPASLRAAGVTVAELLARGADGLGRPPRQPQQAFGGWAGASTLRGAGYDAGELLAAGVHMPWDLKRAGYTMSELWSAGVDHEELIAAGFADAVHQPAWYLGQTYRPLATTKPSQLPSGVSGTDTAKWRQVMGGAAGVTGATASL